MAPHHGLRGGPQERGIHRPVEVHGELCEVGAVLLPVEQRVKEKAFLQG